MGRFSGYLHVMTKPDKCEDSAYWSQIKDKYLSGFKQHLENGSEKDVDELQSIITVCLQCGMRPAMAFAEKILKSKKAIPWKEHPDLARHILDTLQKQGEKCGKTKSETYYNEFMDLFAAILRKNKLINENMDKIIEILDLALERADSPLLTGTSELIYRCQWTKHLEATLKFMVKSYGIFKNYPQLKYDDPIARCIIRAWKSIYDDCGRNTRHAVQYKDHAAQMFLCCKHVIYQKTSQDYESMAHYRWLTDCLNDFIRNNQLCKELVQPVFKACVEMWESKDDKIQSSVDQILTGMKGGHVAELDEDGHVIDTIIRRYLTGDEPGLIGSIEDMYSVCPDKVNVYLDDIAASIECSADYEVSTIVHLFRKVCAEHVEEISDKAVLHLVNALEVESLVGTAFYALTAISEKKPQMLLPHDDVMIEKILSNNTIACQGIGILVEVSMAYPEKAERHLEVLRSVVDKADSSLYKIGPLYKMKCIGQKYPSLLAKYHTYFKELRMEPALTETAGSIINIIEGRSLEAVTREMQEVQQGVREIDDRVASTEDNLKNIGMEIDNSSLAVSGYKQVPREQHGHKENSSSSHTRPSKPALTRGYAQIAQLLNQNDKNRWKLLAQRLGYSVGEVKTFIDEPDSCVAMFRSWFSKNSSSDAVMNVLKHLDEMCGSDAYPIIREILKHTDVDNGRFHTGMGESAGTVSSSHNPLDQIYKAELMEEFGKMMDQKFEALQKGMFDTMKDYMDEKFAEVISSKRRSKHSTTKTSSATLQGSLV